MDKDKNGLSLIFKLNVFHKIDIVLEDYKFPFES